MRLKELENRTVEELESNMSKGGKFVIFTYAISIILVTFRRSSDIYYIKSDEYRISHGFQYLLLSFFLGWCGAPWGLFTQFSPYENLLDTGYDTENR